MLYIANISWHWMRSFINCLVNDIYNLRYACLLYLSILPGHVSFWYRIVPCYVRNQLSYAFVRSSSSRSSSPSSGQRLQGQKQPVYANDMLVNDINRLTKHEQFKYLISSVCFALGAHFLDSLANPVVDKVVLRSSNLLLSQTQHFIGKLLEFIWVGWYES